MSDSAWSQIDAYISEIQSTECKDKDALEQFRIRFLGSKNVLKSLFGVLIFREVYKVLKGKEPRVQWILVCPLHPIHKDLDTLFPS